MKIISNYKDFYDYMSSYYGVDNTVVYKRTHIQCQNFKTRDILHDSTIKTVYLVPCSYDAYTKFPHSFNKAELRYFIINGKKYDFVFEDDKWQLLNQDIYNKYKNKYTLYSETKYNNFKRYDFLDDLSKQVNAPIFECSGSTVIDGKIRYLEVFQHIPVLKEFGIDKIVNIEQFYQELEYYISNVLRDNPDINPPVQIADKDLIEAKGFDKKISFRKRK